MPITQDHLSSWFTYHAVKPEQIEKYQKIRSAALRLAETIISNTPSSADQTTAIRKIREAVMTANASIACNGE